MTENGGSRAVEMSSTERLIKKYKREIEECTKTWERLVEESMETFNYILRLQKWVEELEEDEKQSQGKRLA